MSLYYVLSRTPGSGVAGWRVAGPVYKTLQDAAFGAKAEVEQGKDAQIVRVCPGTQQGGRPTETLYPFDM